MSKGIVVHLDDDQKGVLDLSKNYFDQLKTDLDYVCCTKSEEFIKQIDEKYQYVKALVFDLVGEGEDGVDLKKKKTDFIKQLDEKYKTLRVPIFIFSAHLSEYDGFFNAGTVFRFDKGNHAFETVAAKIKLFHETGFLNLFCFNGEIEQLLLKELHDSFVKQFSSKQNGSDIEGIIQSVVDAKKEIPQRTKEIFTRIALRSLLASLMIDKSVQGDGFNESKVSAVEHYLRRVNVKNVPVWTGDIFISNDGKNRLMILAPRCDLATKGKDNLLVCSVAPSDGFKKGEAEKYMRDNIATKRLRYLPKTSIFEGGAVDLSEHKVIPKQELAANYTYAISLSDELTNEILAKFCAYLLRTSLPEVDPDELKAFFN